MSTIPAGLYLVATPIGNMGDITMRALEVLRAADLVICEDTRVTQKLLSNFGLKKKLSVYNDHSTENTRQKIIDELRAEKILALVSDAGTPLISDPGYKLVRDVRLEGIPVFSVPGASAVLAALTISGLPTDKFMFCGFLPNKTVARKKELEELASIPATLIFYETAKRIKKVLSDMQKIYPDRQAVIAREITKKFEEVLSGDPAGLLEKIGNRELKGEIVLLVMPSQKRGAKNVDLDREIEKYLDNNTVKEIVNILHEEYGGSRKQIYDRTLALKNGKKK